MMRGERLAWYRLAYHLRQPLQKVQRATTSREFEEWIEFLDWQMAHDLEPIHYYLAQVAMEVRRTINPKKKYKLTDFLLKFGSVKKPEPKTAEQKKAWIEKSKAVWSALAKRKPQ